jgi:hypothetical protein
MPTDADEFAALREVALDYLHTTEDDVLQALLWQLLERQDQQEVRLAGLRAGMVVLLEGTS